MVKSFSNIRILGIILSILGIAVSYYLFHTKITGGEFTCTLSSCGIVNNSQYSNIFGVPVALLGVVFYISVFILLWLKSNKAFLLLATGGLFFSVYLTYIEAFVIHAWCQWCLVSAWLAVSLFVISILINKK